MALLILPIGLVIGLIVADGRRAVFLTLVIGLAALLTLGLAALRWVEVSPWETLISRGRSAISDVARQLGCAGEAAMTLSGAHRRDGLGQPRNTPPPRSRTIPPSLFRHLRPRDQHPQVGAHC
jgi:hypothetical protein